MIDFVCKYCGDELSIFDARNIGDTATIKVEPCSCTDSQCDKETCSKYTELESELQGTLTQQNIDIEGNDEMLKKIRKVSEKWGGMIQDEINKILEGED